MSEDVKKRSLFSIFEQTQETLQEAKERAKKEAGAPKIERYRISDDKNLIRILPIAPKLDAEGNVLPVERKGYSYPLHQLFLKIQLPTKEGRKPKVVNIPVIRSSDKEVGFSADLIDTYVKIAKELYGDDEKFIEVIKNGSYGGGLRWNSMYAMYVLDLKDKRKGPMIWQASRAQYSQIENRKLDVWEKLQAKQNEPLGCVVSSIFDAFPVEITRGNNGGKIEYRIDIDYFSGNDQLSEDELQKLLDMPRIDEIIYRFTRYQLEAEMFFLRQFDKIHDVKVCDEPDFQDTYEKLIGELPTDDNSHFDLSEAAKKDETDGEMTVDSMWDEYDALVADGYNENSKEFQQFRARVIQFAQDKDLDIRLSHGKTTKQLLNEVTDELTNEDGDDNEANAQSNEEQSADAPVEERKKERNPKPTLDDDEADEPVQQPEKAVEAPTTSDEVQERPRRRRLR